MNAVVGSGWCLSFDIELNTAFAQDVVWVLASFALNLTLLAAFPAAAIHVLRRVMLSANQ